MPPVPHDTSGRPPLALVTGAAGIIGPSIVRRLRSDGWRVVATDYDAASFALYEKAFGEPVEAEAILPADLGTPEACAALIHAIEADHGGVSALVHGAAMNFPAALGAISGPSAHQLFAINFWAPLFLTQAALPALQSNRGSVVNLSSVLVNEPRRANLLYACSKASLEKATEIMALELAEAGVRVNNLRIGRVPGYAFLRESIQDLPAAQARGLVADLLAERREHMAATLGAQSFGLPEEIAHAVAFLLSPDARFINGQTLVADGGYRPGAQASAPLHQPSLDERIATWLDQHHTASETSCASVK